MEDDVRTKHTEDGHRSSLGVLGESRWEAYVYLIFGSLCLLDALIENGLNVRSLIRDGAFGVAMLWFLMFYASDLRYRLCKEVRNN